MTNKRLVDDINNAFIDFIKEYRGTRYVSTFKKINSEIIDKGMNITQSDIRNIVNRNVNDQNFDDVAVFSVLLGALTTILQNRRLDRNQRNMLAPVLLVLGIYSISNPKRFVNKMQQSIKSPKSNNEKRVKAILTQYFENNKELINKINEMQRQALIRTQVVAKTEQAKRMIDEMVKMTEKGKSFQYQDYMLRRKFNSNKVMMRALDTEVHSALEVGKLEQAKDDGFTTKTWRTQRDSKVRKTTWHSQVANKTIPINEEFVVGSLRANAPGDERLPVGERINCRCYLVYE